MTISEAPVAHPAVTRSVSGRSAVLTVAERKELGRAERNRFPRKDQEHFEVSLNRPDPVDVLEAQAAGRLTHLLPVRYGRMSASPFAFLRGSAAIMAWDLGQMPHTKLEAQLCGDAHLSNFGFFGSPERQLLFDINDFDETLPGPWEWDVKRLAASVVVAGRNNGFSKQDCHHAVVFASSVYREKMAEFSEFPFLETWYSHFTSESIIESISEASALKRFKAKAGVVSNRSSIEEAMKITTVEDDKLRVIENPPLVVRLDPDQVESIIQPLFRKYLRTLQDDRRTLLERYRYEDSALRVGGVGSVGTRCYVVALSGRDVHDPLVLQLKEADKSVLAPYLRASAYNNQAQRVVCGQRLVQGIGDIFLGWIRHENGREFYWRQLRDKKASIDPTRLSPKSLHDYASMCARVLARAHSRSGDPIQISSYVGKSERFDEAIATFAERYADQNERDYETFMQAIRSGRIEAQMGV
jgi:uncharacterized protein (DUF2252 family)